MSSQNLKQYQDQNSNTASEFIEYPQNDEAMQEQAARTAQIMAESRRRKGQLLALNIREETDKINNCKIKIIGFSLIGYNLIFFF